MRVGWFDVPLLEHIDGDLSATKERCELALLGVGDGGVGDDLRKHLLVSIGIPILQQRNVWAKHAFEVFQDEFDVVLEEPFANGFVRRGL